MIPIAGGDGGSFRPGEEKANVGTSCQEPAASSQRVDLLDPADPPLLLNPPGRPWAVRDVALTGTLKLICALPT